MIPLEEEAMTVFITIKLGEFVGVTSLIILPAPPFIKRELIRITRVPVTPKVMLEAANDLFKPF